MTKLIGFIGKGGTGKSTLSALFLKYILQKNIKPVLVIDADPNSCLGELLNLKIDTTIGNIRQELMNKRDELNQTSISKSEYCEFALNNAVIESSGFDMIVMGRSDGPGCYCYINNIVKSMIAKLKKNYKLIIADCEAGLEHLSRKTLGDINIAFIVSDLSRKGILTGLRQSVLMDELGIKPEKKYLIINNAMVDSKLVAINDLIKSSDKSKIEFAGIIHKDANISEFELNQKSLLNLPDNSNSFLDMINIMESARILL